MAAKCPHCGSEKVYAVSRSIEYHYIYDLPDEHSSCDYGGLNDSVPDNYEEYLSCRICGRNLEFRPPYREVDVQEDGDHTLVEISSLTVKGEKFDLEWEWIGEGLNGDYEKAPEANDMAMLRATLLIKGIKEQVENGSYCTLAYLGTPPEELRQMSRDLFTSLDGHDSVKRTMQEWTWRTFPTTLPPKEFREAYERLSTSTIRCSRILEGRSLTLTLTIRPARGQNEEEARAVLAGAAEHMLARELGALHIETSEYTIKENTDG